MNFAQYVYLFLGSIVIVALVMLFGAYLGRRDLKGRIRRFERLTGQPPSFERHGTNIALVFDTRTRLDDDRIARKRELSSALAVACGDVTPLFAIQADQRLLEEATTDFRAIEQKLIGLNKAFKDFCPKPSEEKKVQVEQTGPQLRSAR